MLVISVLQRQRQDDKFKVILGFTAIEASLGFIRPSVKKQKANK